MSAGRSSASIHRRHVYRAAALVEQTFPPCDLESAYALVAALNLLNAAVKKEWGTELVGYGYIKGMVSCTFFWLLLHPLEDVGLYWDTKTRVAYLCVKGVQFCFHYVPLLDEHAHLMTHLQPQQWNGKRLQLEALQLMPRKWYGRYAKQASDSRIRRKMLSFGKASLRRVLTEVVGVKLVPRAPRVRPRERICEKQRRIDSWNALNRNSVSQLRLQALNKALHFYIWTVGYCHLCHRPDISSVRLIRYTGDNYDEVRQVISGPNLPVPLRPPESLSVGRLYYRPRNLYAWRALAPSHHLLVLAYYCNLQKGKQRYNLCLTYGIVRYLGMLYPKLRFLNILNYNRLSVRRRIYTPAALARVPLGSKSRRLKVWMVVDPMQLLSSFKTNSLPSELLREYLSMPDYLDMYTVTRYKGRCGLYAYSRFHLLPPVYRRINVHGHFAEVMRDDGKIAIYSLAREGFVSAFIYDAIWFDQYRYVILGRHDGIVDVIHDFVISDF